MPQASSLQRSTTSSPRRCTRRAHRRARPRDSAAEEERQAFTNTRTVQAEAFAPDPLQALVEAAIVERLNMGVYRQVLTEESAERGRLNTLLDDLTEDGKP
jgi:hypothetical protein